LVSSMKRQAVLLCTIFLSICSAANSTKKVKAEMLKLDIKAEISFAGSIPDSDKEKFLFMIDHALTHSKPSNTTGDHRKGLKGFPAFDLIHIRDEGAVISVSIGPKDATNSRAYSLLTFQVVKATQEAINFVVEAVAAQSM
jgi:hypothetical protein